MQTQYWVNDKRCYAVIAKVCSWKDDFPIELNVFKLGNDYSINNIGFLKCASLDDAIHGLSYFGLTWQKAEDFDDAFDRLMDMESTLVLRY